MGESYQYNSNNNNNQQIQQLQSQPLGSSRLGLRVSGASTGGEIVEVQGGHIVRSTGRKDRHSKVCTAKGPRDRRVRLSAHTAIQFYDVQDRLGYDRPSKAVDWLIKKAKNAIDELAELPAWKPTNSVGGGGGGSSRNVNGGSVSNFETDPDQINGFQDDPDDKFVDNGSFLPPSLDQDSIADTIKSFFPMGASSNAVNQSSSSGMQFNQSQDLRLSLQSFQDPIMHNHHHSHSHGHNHNPHSHDSGSSGGNNGMFFDGSGSGWSENPIQRMVAWGSGDGGGGGGYVSPAQVQVPAQATFLQPLFGHQVTANNQLFTQRGPLQSSNAPSFRAWIDPPPMFTGVAIDQTQQPTLAFHHPSSMPGYASGLGGFSGFRIPTRIQGEDEEHDGISDKPSSASSDSHH